MELGFVNGTSHKIEVGNVTPTSSGYYVRFDGGKIYVIEKSGIDSVLNLLTAPPFPATATPVTRLIPVVPPLHKLHHRHHGKGIEFQLKKEYSNKYLSKIIEESN